VTHPPAIAALLALALAACMKGPDSLGTLDDAAPDTGRVLTVIGTGRLLSEPACADVDAVVVSESPGPEVAWQQGAERLLKLTHQLETVGVRPDDMLSIAADLRRTDSGYRLEQRLRVTVRDLRLVPAVLANALGSGAQRVEGARFALADGRAAGDRARERALLDAQEKAQVLAQELQLRLGPVRSVTELEGRAATEAGTLAQPPEPLESVCVLSVTYLLLD
jgi:hypothetical protein